jgi:beta-phosphoglucomutase family hydrolase
MYGVIFDMDGVLVLTGPAHFEAWRAAAAQHGIALSYDEFTHTFGRTNPDVIRIIWGREVEPAMACAIADAKEESFRRIIQAEVPLAPGLPLMLEALRGEGFVLGVGSSAPPENIDLVLDRGGIRKYFASVVDGNQVKRGKPAPDVFLLAAEKARLDPSRCMVVEDAPAGIEAAVAADMVPVGITTTHDEASLRKAGAAKIISSLSELAPGAVKQLFGA